MPHTSREKTGNAAAFRHFSLDGPETSRMRKPLRTLIIEDFPPLIDLYVEKLGNLPGIELINPGPVETFDGAMRSILAVSPEILLLDLNLSEGRSEGFAIHRALRRLGRRPYTILTSTTFKPELTDDINEHIRRSDIDAAFNKFDFEGLTLLLLALSSPGPNH
ncbi:MAG: hypothetical protein AB1324_06115 [Candidatus Micrarchaeota archaeon]